MKCLSEIFNTTISSRNQKEKTGTPDCFTPDEQLKLLFHWFLRYLPEEYLGILLQCSSQTISNNLKEF